MNDVKNIIAVKNIIEFYQKHPDSKASLETWLTITRHADWTQPDSDPVKNNRVVFNIAGNKYRLIAQISCIRKWVFIKFIGSHSDYDKIDASTVDNY